MQTSGLPTRMPTPFANSGAKNPIPIASQISITPGAASFTDGFPPLTRTPISAGGVPPFGLDFNGILNAITVAIQWENAGGRYPYDATFSAAVGGYPKGSLLARSGFDGLWFSTTENNTTNPDAGGAGWVAINGQGGDYGIDTGTANIYAVAFSPAVVSVKDGMTLKFKALNANTGASTFSPNGVAAAPIVSLGHAALRGGEIVPGGEVWLQWDSSIGSGSWVLISASGGNAMSGRLLNIKTFTASGTYTPTTGTNFIKVRLVGGGGAGGGASATTSSQASLGGAGSSGSYGEALITTGFSGVTVTVGGAGAGAAGAAGSAGGASSFGSLVAAPGGLGGAIVSTAGGTVQLSANSPAAGTGGYINARGNQGGPTISTALTTGGIGYGGQSQFGSQGYGAGGSGSINIPSSSAQVGISGSVGIVIVEEYA